MVEAVITVVATCQQCIWQELQYTGGGDKGYVMAHGAIVVVGEDFICYTSCGKSL